MAFYLGFDSSTQGLSALIIDADTGTIVLEEGITFGKDLPEFQCPHGYLESDQPLVAHADPVMWAAAVDMLLQRLEIRNAPLDQVLAISGSGQQHGTVYLQDNFPEALQANPTTLALAVRSALSRQTSPIWIDVSTGKECNEINTALGDAETVRALSGSSASERFSGPQIRKFCKEEPEAYAETATIHLVSSFLCSLLLGDNAPIDSGDGAGMNLLNLERQEWDPDLLDATAPGLAGKLPPVVPSSTVVGNISDYFVKKYGFSKQTKILAWSGDNPNSLIGVGGWRPGTAVVSLGTSDTFFAAMQKPVVDASGYGHVFGNPAGGFMCLICFKNGSLAREKVKDQFNLSWEQFDVDSFAQTPAGNNGNLILPYFEAEITPFVPVAGIHLQGDASFTSGTNPASRVRSLVEAQIMTMKLHTEWIGEDTDTLHVTGGASQSDGICQVLADVFNATVERLETGNSAALGAALRAAQGAGNYDWDSLTKTFCTPAAGKTVAPIPENVKVYQDLLPKYAAFEKETLAKISD